VLFLGDMDEMLQQSLAPAFPLRGEGYAESQQMGLFRSYDHDPVAEQATILLQYKAMVARVDGIAEITAGPGKQKDFPFDGNHLVQVSVAHAPDSRQFL
jgi:hypothetical protein